MTPAPTGAVSPLWITQARVSFSPAVKNVRRPSRSNARWIRRDSPDSVKPNSAMNCSRSAGPIVTNSASRSPQMCATWAPVRCAYAVIACTCLPPPFRSSSPALAMNSTGFIVIRNSGCRIFFSASVNATWRSMVSRCRASTHFSNAASCTLLSASPDFARFWTRSMLRFRVCRSVCASSSSTISASPAGSIAPLTCCTLSFSKQRTTCSSASLSLIAPRKPMPMPAPSADPDTSAGMSVTCICAGPIFLVGMNRAISCRRGSGTSTIPGTGAVVENMWLLRSPEVVSVIAWKIVVLPTLGRPTMPAERTVRAAHPTDRGGPLKSACWPAAAHAPHGDEHLGGVHAALVAPRVRLVPQPLRRARVRVVAQFARVAGHRRDLAVEHGADVDPRVGHERARIGPFGAARGVERVDGLDAGLGRPRRHERSLEQQLVVLVDVATVLAVDDLRAQFADHGLDRRDDAGQRQRVELLVGQVQEAHVGDAEDARRLPR